jgi:hypothetical protein
MRNNTANKYAAINSTFNELSKRNEHGLRYDTNDVITLIAKQFYCSPFTVERALRTKLS